MKLYRKECETCGKIIRSLHKTQAEYNFKAHQISCKAKEEKKNEQPIRTNNGSNKAN